MNSPQAAATGASGRALAQPDAAAEALGRACGLPAAIAALLISRGVDTPDKAAAFLQPDFAQLHSPLLMLGMRAAVKRLRAALEAGERVLIYGDYDVDGTVATVLLKTAIERAAASLGKSADVRFHIPHRLREGYGIQGTRLADAVDEGIRLVISVDTGIRAFAAAEDAARLGVDLIITDHHLPEAGAALPAALAVLNPNQAGCPYPCKDLCGAAVSFKLAQALLESAAQDDGELERLRQKTLPSFLKLLAIATIADAVPLTGENRAIAALGLRELRRPSQTGLRALMDLAAIDTSRPIAAADIGFRLAPRINAAGRMDIASDVVQMFLSRDAAEGRALAEKLHHLNDDRRATEAEALRQILAEVSALEASAEGLPGALVLDDGAAHPGVAVEAADPARSAVTTPWHRGVLGILASRVVDRTGAPALVLTHEPGDGGWVAHGSGRSVAGFHLLDALTAVHAADPATPLFDRFGGHAHAVGFALPSAHVPELRRRLAAYAAAHRPASTEQTDTVCDLEVRLADLTPEFFAALERLGPFGNGNPEPLFLTRGVRVSSALRVIKERHLRLTVEDPLDGARQGGMAWSRRVNFAELARAEAWQPGTLLDLVYRVRNNPHPDFGGWELEVVLIANALADSDCSRRPAEGVRGAALAGGARAELQRSAAGLPEA